MLLTFGYSLNNFVDNFTVNFVDSFKVNLKEQFGEQKVDNFLINFVDNTRDNFKDNLEDNFCTQIFQLLSNLQAIVRLIVSGSRNTVKFVIHCANYETDNLFSLVYHLEWISF